MKVLIQNKSMKKKLFKAVYMFLLCCILTGVSVSAENIITKEEYEIGYGDIICNYKDLLSKFELNSITYKRNMLDYKIKVLTGTLTDESYANVNDQYLNTIHKIAELNESKKALIEYRDSLIVQSNSTDSQELNNQDINNDNTALINEINNQIASIEVQISQYSNNSNSLAKSLSEVALQKDIADFYADYQDIIVKEAQNKSKNEFLKKCYNLIIYKEQLDYYNSYQKYLDFILQADTIKYKLGMITQTTLDFDKTNLATNETTITESKNIFDSALSLIKRDTAITDNTKIKLCLSSTKMHYDMENTMQQFINNNSSYCQLQNYIRSYQNYLESSSTNSNASYQQTELIIKDYKLQLDELEGNIKIFVKDAMQLYENAFQSRIAAWYDLQVKIRTYYITKAKIDSKKSTQIELQKSLCEKEAAEVTYYQSCYKIIIWQDIIDHNLYNITP